jgi:hypothetical protein
MPENVRFKQYIPVILVVLLIVSLTGCFPFDNFTEPDQPNQPPEEKLPPGSSGAPGSIANPVDPTSPVVLPGTPVSGNTAGSLKPVCFLNIGTTAATIMPWTYVPLNTETAAMPPYASTVASPGGNSSACLSLPLGTYSWCYHWEVGDVNDDGMIEYAHTLWLQRVVLDESDTDDMDLAEKVPLSAPAGLEEKPGQCDLETRIVLDIRPFIVDSQHLDSFFYGYSVAGLAHNEDYVTLKGPITVDYYFHHCDAAPCTTSVIEEPPVRVIILAGETHQFYLEDTVGEHLGNWDMYIQLISIDG